MKRCIAFLVGLAAAGCCGHPLRLTTDNLLTFNGPVETRSKVVTETPPVADNGPVQPRALPGGGCPPGAPKVALIDVDGLLLNQNLVGPLSLGENPVALFREKLEAAADDDSVRAVVVRLNSPGGSVAATDVMWRDLTAFKASTHKPVVVSLLDVGAGGAYFVATAGDLIMALPTTVTGGIGVIFNLYNLKELMAQQNIFSQEIKSGKFIDTGSPVRNMSEEARAIYQAMAGEYHDRFVRVVRAARAGVRGDDPTNFDGRVFTAEQAVARGLIDRVGYPEDAVAVAREMAHAPDAALILYRRGNDPARSLYAVTPNWPIPLASIPVPGIDRARLPAFLYLWQPEATLEKVPLK
jgi:protease-4